MLFISFDVANKSLATTVVRYDLNILKKNIQRLAELYSKYEAELTYDLVADLTLYVALLEEINTILDSFMEIEKLEVVDLIPGKKVKDTNAIERTHMLHKYLNSTFYDLEEQPYVLVEYQMNANDKSRAIQSQIIMFFMQYYNKDQDNIRIIGPSLKNTLFIGGDPNSYHGHFLQKYSDNYTANKNHTKYLLVKVLNAINQDEWLSLIKKKNWDDAADSFMMIPAFLKSLPYKN